MPEPRLFDLIEENESHALVIGASGTGKTTLIKQEVQAGSEGLLFVRNRVLIIDRIGNYKGFVEYHGPFPLNPLEFIQPNDFIDAISQSVISTYGDIQTPWSPAQEKIVEDCLEGTAPRGGGEPARSIPELIQCVKTSRYSDRDDEMARKAVERRIALFNDLLFARRTHGLLKAWLEGRLNASLAIDVSRVPLPKANAYVYALLAVLARSRAIKGPMIVVIDEAQYYATVGFRGGLSLLEEAIRVSRNFGTYYIAMTQDPEGLPKRLVKVFKVYVIFNIVNRKGIGELLGFDIEESAFNVPFRAFVKILLTSEDAYAKYRQKGPGYTNANITVKPKEVKPLPNAKAICPDLDPSLPVVEGRQVRDYIARNIKCLLDAEAGLEA